MNEKILVVDDDESLRNLYKLELTDEGLDVHLASSGSEALAKLEKDKFALIVLDIKMPGMDGIEVLRKVKEKWKHIPVILSTAYVHYKQEFGIWASDAYVVKSHDLKELTTTIKDILNTGRR